MSWGYTTKDKGEAMGDGKELEVKQFSVKDKVALTRKRKNTEQKKPGHSKKQKVKERSQNNQRRCGGDQCLKEENKFSILKQNPGQENFIVGSGTKSVKTNNHEKPSTEKGQVSRPQEGPHSTARMALSSREVVSEDGMCPREENGVGAATVVADSRGSGSVPWLSTSRGEDDRHRDNSSGKDSVTTKSKQKKRKGNKFQEKGETKLQKQHSGRPTKAVRPEKEVGGEEETVREKTGSPGLLGKDRGDGQSAQADTSYGKHKKRGAVAGGESASKEKGQQSHGEGRGLESDKEEAKMNTELTTIRKKKLADIKKKEELLGGKQIKKKKSKEGKEVWVERIKKEVNGKLDEGTELEKTQKNTSRLEALVTSKEKKRKKNQTGAEGAQKPKEQRVEGRDLEKDGQTEERKVQCAGELSRAGADVKGEAGGMKEETGQGEQLRSVKEEKGQQVSKQSRRKEKLRTEEEPACAGLCRGRREKADSTSSQKESKKGTEASEGGNRWKWWEEEKREDGVKWKQLEHRGPYFAPSYEPLPNSVHFYYDGKPLKLSLAAEEVATFYGKMLDHEYTTKEVFQSNFFKDWRKEMTAEERKVIIYLDKCDFTEIHRYFVDRSAAQKALPREEKQKLKEEAEKLQQEFGYCILDGHREKIGNFKTEPPGLFRGRGDHPKMGMLKRRIRPEDVVINCSKDSKIPEPPTGHSWKEVRSDNTVTWLASWTENIQNSIKYVMLNPSSKLKGEKDWQKYELARRLKGVVGKIRAQYRADWKSREMKKRQRAVALYFIDKLALRAGNEKEEGETADTVGCCSLRVEHVRLLAEAGNQEHVVELDFLGKDSIRYYNRVPVEKAVYKNLQLFMENKDLGDELFDRLTTTGLNKHLQDLMDGLTAKVFRTYNASATLQEQLRALTRAEDSIAAKILSYNRANRAVAVLCNHQRATPKTFARSMQNLQLKIQTKQERVAEAKAELEKAKVEHCAGGDSKSQSFLEKKRRLLERLEEQLMKLTTQATDKEENKQVALGTSKLNYLDPRISVAWCKKFAVPIEKIYNKMQREKFAWAIDMAGEDFEF
ncbi:DNA topoisomerase I, mitochondrial isoform X2 [Tamandua tetradactyla]|uniref:DNA topoisomerase I, mitochondrial isoform X2 n=1 Tax=Tamandua tetradactyla TaxID=48850 RepID=UPI004053ADF2